MSHLPPIPKNSIFFAPLEGITSEVYRKTIQTLYPEWDYLACDFLRVPGAGRYPKAHLLKHFGPYFFSNSQLRSKTIFQILTSTNAFTKELIEDAQEMGIPWIDLNLGCPSKTVCKHLGGSFLLKDLIQLRPILKTIRTHFKGRFSAKVRLGFENPDGFEDIIKLLNDEGIELITVHARTTHDLYKNPARWHFIGQAVKISKVPIIGNGDLWAIADINKMFQETGCHGVMIARGALKTPWIARQFKNNENECPEIRVREISNFLHLYHQNYAQTKITEMGLLKQSKSITRYIFDDLKFGKNLRRNLLLSSNLNDFRSHLLENQLS